MKILYLGCHEMLEWSEMRLLTELDERTNAGLSIEVFSLLGAYMNPLQSGGFMRSVIPKGRFYPQLYNVALQCDKDNIHPELLEWADVVLMTHNSAIPGQAEQQRWLVRNWPLFEKMGKQHKIIWRSIGQSTPAIEKEITEYRQKGLKVVRYSPLEEKLPFYGGADAVIRFYEDESEFCNWTGEKKQAITVTQSYKKRGDHLNFYLYDRITSGFPRKVYGRENADLGELWGGERSFHELKEDYRQNRVFVYTGTTPAPYTMALIEAMMTGIPVVAIGSELRKHASYPWPNYEIETIISNGINGYVSNNVDELRGYVQLLLEDDGISQRISEAGRARAIELWGMQNVAHQWKEFLGKFK